MDNELKTVGGVSEDDSLSLVSPILKEQKKQIADMRSILLTFNRNDVGAVRRAMNNITVLRVYHQVARIIEFTDLMDDLEDKIYDSIRMNIGGMESADPETMLVLLRVQSQLQETMIQSQQLIKPYLDMNIEFLVPEPEMEDTSFGVSIISQESRNNIRNGATALLTELRKANPDLPQGDMKEVNGDADDRSADTQ
jgi:hypothetical protein